VDSREDEVDGILVVGLIATDDAEERFLFFSFREFLNLTWNRKGRVPKMVACLRAVDDSILGFESKFEFDLALGVVLGDISDSDELVDVEASACKSFGKGYGPWAFVLEM